MNIAMEQTEEYVDGKLSESFGDAFIRGNNGEGGREKSSRRLAACRSLLYSAVH